MARKLERFQKSGAAGKAEKTAESSWAVFPSGAVTLPLTAGLNLVIVQWQAVPGSGAFIRRAAGSHVAADRYDFGHGQQEVSKIIDAKHDDVLALFANEVTDGVTAYVSITPLPE